MPYMKYPEVDFDVVVGTYGDAFDRYAIRLNEVRESMRIVHQILDKMPSGDYRIQDKKVTPPPRARIDESMEALIHHFKIFTEGFKVPEGEVYVASRARVASSAATSPATARPAPVPHCTCGRQSFVNIQCLPT
jgi:NADH-quinone oxidoreductase subunit D